MFILILSLLLLLTYVVQVKVQLSKKMHDIENHNLQLTTAVKQMHITLLEVMKILQEEEEDD